MNYTPPVFNPIYSKGLKESDKDSLVSCILFVGISTNPTKPKSSLYHWRLYLKIREEKSVMLDIQPLSGNEMPATLQIASKDQVISNSAAVHQTYTLIKKITVKQIIDIITTKERQKYIFTNDGIGCRYWCRIILSDLEDEKYIASGSHLSLLAWIDETSVSRPLCVTKEWHMGAFYK